ncbi:peptidase [Arthrobacter sp. NPDC056691]|uniref:peptidase n=1 Tax=Arthrobacter sp. NPDC056691 TaxID=3345913 RepID=UPI00366B7CF0
MPADHGVTAEGLPPGVRRSASGRIPQWAIDEALGIQQGPAPWRSGPPLPVRPTRGHGRKWAIGAGIALLLGLSSVPMLFERFVLPAVLPYLPGAPVPPPGFEAADAPLGQPPASTGSKAYALQESPDPGQPFAAYDPCRPVHYVVRPDDAPPGADQMIQEAVARVSAATGLRFVYDGPTSEAPSEEREMYQPDLYGKRWAPVLIAWSNPAESPDLAGDVDGLGGSGYAYVEGQPYVLVAGQVALDAPDFADILQWPDGRRYARAVIMHELAHVVGLDHVNDPTQLMNPEGADLTEFASGDLAGLAILGGGECVPEL